MTTARRALVKRFVCRPDRLRLCPCYFDALLYARLYTDSCGKVCLVLRESDREVMARTGPKKQERDDEDFEEPKKQERDDEDFEEPKKEEEGAG